MLTWQFDNVSWLYAASVVIALILAYEAWRMRSTRGAKEFGILCLSISVWCLGYFLGFFNASLSWKMIFLRVEYAGIISSSYFWLVFIGTYVANEFLQKPRNLELLAIIPALSFILVLTVTDQHFFYSSYGVKRVGDFVTLHKTYAAGFYIQTVYAYLLVIGGTLLLLYSIYQMPDRYRKQSVLIGVAIGVVLVPNFLYVAKTRVFGIYDPTPVSFTAAGMIFGFIMVRYGFLDLVPIAYRQVFRSVESGIVIIDGSQRVLELNPGAEKILSCTSRKSIGREFSDICPECAVLVQEIYQDDQDRELQLGKEGRTYSVSLSPLSNSGGELLGRIIMLYDITELRSALDELDTFAHSVAHDLKTPLSLLTGFSDMLSREDLPKQERDEAVEVIRVYSNKMINIVDELLTLARVRRQQNVKFISLEMGPIVKSAMLRLERFAQEKKSKVYIPEEWPNAVGYAPWVEEVWVNYLSNAMKYGGQSPNIYLGSEVSGGAVKYWVKDNGPGLSMKDQKNLFKEFSRVAGTSGETGQGLGLFIVGRIVARLGGEAGVESEPGSGAKFYFTLPRASD